MRNLVLGPLRCKRKSNAKSSTTQIELATAKQQVMELKVELSKAKEATQAAQAAVNTARQKFYDLRVQKTEA